MEQQKNNNGIINKINQTYAKHKSKNTIKNKIKDDGVDTVEIENNMNEQMENNENEINDNSTVEELTNANADLEDMLKRRVAEFENFKRRTDKEKMELLEYGSIKLLMKFVDLLDDLKNAQAAANSSQDISAVLKGLEIINQKTEKLFAEEGVEQMNISIGDEFDVEKHEAMMRQPSELPEGQITMVMQNGYTYKNKVIRYAKVATSVGSCND